MAAFGGAWGHQFIAGRCDIAHAEQLRELFRALRSRMFGVSGAGPRIPGRDQMFEYAAPRE